MTEHEKSLFIDKLMEEVNKWNDAWNRAKQESFSYKRQIADLKRKNTKLEARLMIAEISHSSDQETIKELFAKLNGRNKNETVENL